MSDHIQPIKQYPLSEWMRIVQMSALAAATTLPTTYRMAIDVMRRGIKGDLVECGVYAGAQAAVMARAIIDHMGFLPDDRKVHLFDSFAGIPLAGLEDIEFRAAGHPAGVAACSLENVKANMRGWGIPDHMLVYHEGDFEQTAAAAPIGEIALLRLDGDLYRSTKACLDGLGHKVTPGGWVILDDFELAGARQAFIEYTRGVVTPVYWMKQ